MIYGIKICAELSSVLSQSTRLTDEWTDGRTPFSWLDRVACNARSAVKNVINEVAQGKDTASAQLIQVW